MAHRRIAALAVVATVVLGLGGVALANGAPERPAYQAASDPTSTSAGGRDRAPRSTPESRPPRPPKGERRDDADRGPHESKEPRQDPGRKGEGEPARRRGATHGDLIVPKEGGGYETVTFDRGIVTVVDAGSLKVRRDDGPSATLQLTGATRYEGAARSAGEIRSGDAAHVLSAGGSARVVRTKRR